MIGNLSKSIPILLFTILFSCAQSETNVGRYEIVKIEGLNVANKYFPVAQPSFPTAGADNEIRYYLLDTKTGKITPIDWGIINKKNKIK